MSDPMATFSLAHLITWAISGSATVIIGLLLYIWKNELKNHPTNIDLVRNIQLHQADCTAKITKGFADVVTQSTDNLKLILDLKIDKSILETQKETGNQIVAKIDAIEKRIDRHINGVKKSP